MYNQILPFSRPPIQQLNPFLHQNIREGYFQQNPNKTINIINQCYKRGNQKNNNYDSCIQLRNMTVQETSLSPIGFLDKQTQVIRKNHQRMNTNQRIELLTQVNQCGKPIEILRSRSSEKPQNVNQKSSQPLQVLKITSSTISRSLSSFQKQQWIPQNQILPITPILRKSKQIISLEVQKIIGDIKKSKQISIQTDQIGDCIWDTIPFGKPETQQTISIDPEAAADFYNVKSQSFHNEEYSQNHHNSQKIIKIEILNPTRSPSQEFISTSVKNKSNSKYSGLILVVDQQQEAQNMMSRYHLQTQDELSLSQTDIFDMTSEAKNDSKAKLLSEFPYSVNSEIKLISKNSSVDNNSYKNQYDLLNSAKQGIQQEVKQIIKDNLLIFNHQSDNQLNLQGVLDQDVSDFMEQQDSKITEILQTNQDNAQTSRSNILISEFQQSNDVQMCAISKQNLIDKVNQSQQVMRTKSSPSTQLNSDQKKVNKKITDEEFINKVKRNAVSKQKREYQVSIGNLDLFTSQIVEKVLQQIENQKLMRDKSIVLPAKINSKQNLSNWLNQENNHPSRLQNTQNQNEQSIKVLNLPLMEKINNRSANQDDIKFSPQVKSDLKPDCQLNTNSNVKKSLSFQTQTLSIHIRPEQTTQSTATPLLQISKVSSQENQMFPIEKDKQIQEEQLSTKNQIIQSFNQQSKRSENYSEYTSNMNQELFEQLMSDQFFPQSNQKQTVTNQWKEEKYFAVNEKLDRNKQLSNTKKAQGINNKSNNTQNTFMQRLSTDIKRRSIKQSRRIEDKKHHDKSKLNEIEQYVKLKEQHILQRNSNKIVTHQRLFQDATRRKEQQQTKSQIKLEKDELLASIMSDRRIMGNLEKVQKYFMTQYVDYQKKQEKCDIGGIIDQIIDSQTKKKNYGGA